MDPLERPVYFSVNETAPDFRAPSMNAALAERLTLSQRRTRDSLADRATGLVRRRRQSASCSGDAPFGYPCHLRSAARYSCLVGALSDQRCVPKMLVSARNILGLEAAEQLAVASLSASRK